MIPVNEASGTETRETSWWLSVSLQFYLDPRDFIPKYWWSVSFNFRYLSLATIWIENFIWLVLRGGAELGCHQHHFHYQHHHHPYPIIVPDGGSEVGLKLDVITIAITIWDVPFFRLCSFNIVQNALDPPFLSLLSATLSILHWSLCIWRIWNNSNHNQNCNSLDT